MADKNDGFGFLKTFAKVAINTQAPFLGGAVLDNVLSEDDFLKGLEKLIERDFLTGLDLDALSKMDAKSLRGSAEFDDVMKKVKNAVRSLQAESAGRLKADEIFGKKSLNWLLTEIGCNGKLERPDSSNADKASSNVKALPPFEYRYFIEELPTASFDTKKLLRQCWLNWQRICGVVATETKKRNKANVVVKVTDIDGAGNVLADAHIGPANGFVLELRIDASENWDETKFEAGISHEIGHLIGLEHTNTANQLMNTHVGTITKPQKEDIALAVARWKESRFEDAGEKPEVL